MPNIWSIGGGKGGSGKSFITGNLGILLAKGGYKTLLIDVDLGAANLHTIIGLPLPKKSISDFLNKKVGALQETVEPTPVQNLYLISGAMNNLDIANLAHEQKLKIIRNISKLSYDYILLDLGAGTSFNTIDFFMISNLGIFVTTPEPTSIENIYRLIRSVYFRKIRQVLNSHNFRALAEEAQERDGRATVSNPDILLYIMKELDPEKGEILENELRTFNFKLALNQLRKQDNPNIGALICKIIQRHLALKMHFVGNITFDERVHNAVCKKIPFLDLYPYTQTTLDLRTCHKNLLTIDEAEPILQNAVD
ncbi:MAG: AAA family ATPase [Syntrophales bacterium]|jgi:flagellar biosynthesis protein FlhG